MANLTACSSSGLKDWLLQRITAVVIMLYSLFVFITILSVSGDNAYYAWVSIFQKTWVKIFTILALLALVIHAWIGMWTIFTDYIKCKYLLVTLQILAVLGYFVCFIWLICILF